jgi:hypothetical protein
MEREEPVAAELLRKMAPLLATSPSDHRSKERELAAALDRSRSGGKDLDHRLLYGASAQDGGSCHKQAEKTTDLHLIYSGALPRPTLAS